MQDSQIPVKFAIIFASSAVAGDVTSPIPTTPQAGGLVSLPTGWQEINFTPVAGGGVPPWGKDFNGLFQIVTAWLQWYQAGGPVTYDPTFQASIGGYPLGAIVQSMTTPGMYWRSTADNNVTNPDASGAGWVQWPFPIPIPIADGGTNNVGPFTLGSVIFSDGTKLTQDNAAFCWLESIQSLGIGTNAPNAKLHVNGTFRADGLIHAAGNLQVDGSVLVQGAAQFDSVTTCGADLVTLESFLVQSSTPNAGVQLTCPEPVVEWTNTVDGATWVMQHADTGLLTWSFNTVGKMQFDTSGNMIIQGTLTQLSDAAAKEDVASLGSVLDRVLRLRPVSYRYRDAERRDVGFIAQELRELFPELVSATRDGMLGVAYTNGLAILTRAVQELAEEVRRPWWRKWGKALRRSALAALISVAAIATANAQCAGTNTSPQFSGGGNVFGRLATQWNQYFAAKIDASAGQACDLKLFGTIDATAATFLGLAITQPQTPAKWATAAVLPQAPAYNNGTSGVGATLTATTNNVALVVDGGTVALGDRVLVKNQADATQNGVYTKTQNSGVGVPWILTRATDWDTSAEMQPKSLFFVSAGTANAGTSWFEQTTGALIPGSSSIVFVQFSASNAYAAGTGITLTGNIFSITSTAVSPNSYGSATQVPSYTVNAQGQLTVAANVTIAIPVTAITDGSTGTGAVVRAVSPVIGGTANIATLLGSGSYTITGNIGGVSLGGSNALYLAASSSAGGVIQGIGSSSDLTLADRNGAGGIRVISGGTVSFPSLATSGGVGYGCLSASFVIAFNASGCNPSDARLKTNFVALTAAEAKAALGALPLYHYDWADDQQRAAQGPQLGIKAQDVQAVLPQLVSTGQVPYEVNGAPVDHPLSLDYSRLVVPLLAWVQNIEGRVAALEAR